MDKKIIIYLKAKNNIQSYLALEVDHEIYNKVQLYISLLCIIFHWSLWEIHIVFILNTSNTILPKKKENSFEIDIHVYTISTIMPFLVHVLLFSSREYKKLVFIEYDPLVTSLLSKT